MWWFRLIVGRVYGGAGSEVFVVRWLDFVVVYFVDGDSLHDKGTNSSS